MAHITIQGNPIETAGSLPVIDTMAPDFSMTTLDLSEKTLADFAGKRIVLNIFPSVDTETCSLSVKMFNKQASHLENTVILCISRDLPFAQKRFCGAEGIENVIMLSEFRDSNFSDAYGLRVTTGPLAGLHSRAVVVIDETGKVIYTEQVAEVTNEPNYKEAMAVLV